MKKVLVIGCSGAGKTTFAAEISQKTGLPFYATDPFYWKSGWRHTSNESLVKCVDAVTSKSVWVLDGNFEAHRDLVWRRADTIIWLDYSFGLVLSRIVRRNLRLWLSQEPTWSGNRMSWRRAWSGIRHSYRSHAPKRKKYPTYLRAFRHLRIHRFQHPVEADDWLASLPDQA